MTEYVITYFGGNPSRKCRIRREEYERVQAVDGLTWRFRR